jgi:hypothetical protein
MRMQQLLRIGPQRRNATMDNSASTDIKIPLKKCWKVGNNTVVVIDKRLVERLGINEENCMFEEELTNGGIVLRIVRR